MKNLAAQSFKTAQIVLFDWDGTIVNSADFVPDIHSHVLTQLGIPLSPLVIKDHLGISQTALIRMAVVANNLNMGDEDIDKNLIPRFVELEDKLLDEHYADGRIHLRDGFIALLDDLKARSVPFGIVSNAYDNVTHKRLEDTGLMGAYFSISDVFGRSRVGTAKPDPTQIIAACKDFGFHPTEGIFFGDTQSDRGACEAANMPMLQIGYASLSPAPLCQLENFCGLICEPHAL